MKWIKASERQPEDWEFVFCRTVVNPIRFIASEAMNGTVWGVHPYLNLDNGLSVSVVEWLDESEEDIIDSLECFWECDCCGQLIYSEDASSYDCPACKISECDTPGNFVKSNK